MAYTGDDATGMGHPVKNYADALMLAAALVAIGSYLIRETSDADTWWQVAIGRDILEHLAIPRIDRFATAALGRSYHDSHWFFQVILALCDRVGGMAAVGVAMVALWSATLATSYCAVRRWVPVATAALLVCVVALVCSDRFTPRPDIVTCLMIALFQLRLQEGKWRTVPHLGLFALLQLVWSNSHGLFVIGPFMAGCYLAAALWRRNQVGGGREDLPALAILFPLLLLASLATPYGIGGWEYALLLVKEAGTGAPALFRDLSELTPTFGATAWKYPDFWAFVLLLALTVMTTVPLLVRRRVSPARLLTVTARSIAEVSGRRNMPLFALAAAPLAAENIAMLFPGFRFPTPAKVAVGVLLLLLSWLPLSGRYYQMIEYPTRFGFGASPTLFPRELPSFLRRQHVTGVLYNSNYLGGFCLYHGFRPLVDGRWEVYDPAVLTRIFEAPFKPDVWEWLVSSYGVGGAVLMHASPEAAALLPSLGRDPRWRLVYYDNAASFWLRVAAGQIPPPADISTFPASVGKGWRIEDFLATSAFFRLVGAPATALTCLEQGALLQEKRELVLEKIGQVQLDLGKTADSEQTFLRLLQVNGRNTAAMNELAFIAYGRGDLQRAASYLRRALQLKPGDPDIRANYERLVNDSRFTTGGK